MSVNLEYYKIFYMVSKYGSITAASEALCISQPAVSQAIKKLELLLGGELMIRIPKGVRLTPEGEVLYSYIKKGYDLIQLGEQNFQKMIDFENGEVRIGASDMTLRYYLFPYLERFHKQYPKIKVSVTNGPTPDTLTYLNEGAIDFGIVSTPFETKQDVEVQKVREIEDIFVAGSEFKYLMNQSLAFTELERLPTICLEQNTSTRKYLNSFLDKHHVKLEPEFELATSDMIVQFALRNFGIGCVMRDFAKPYLDRKELFELNFISRLNNRHICIIKSKRNPISKAAIGLLDIISQECNNFKS